MTVYVDSLFTAIPRNAQAGRHGNQWCHLICDGDLAELHIIAAAIGLKRSYFQREAVPHYDLTPAMRVRAIQAGAVEASNEELRPVKKQWRLRWQGGQPDWE